jgi:hypothetical protein
LSADRVDALLGHLSRMVNASTTETGRG